MNPSANLEKLRVALGLTKAPVVMKNLETIASFFTGKLGVSPFNWIPYLKGIDYSKEVELLLLNPGREVIRHKPDDSRPKPFLYFTDVGSSPMRTGTNFPQVTFERFQVSAPIWALVSSASSISFSPTDRVSRPGGAKQLIIATGDFRHLTRVR